MTAATPRDNTDVGVRYAVLLEPADGRHCLEMSTLGALQAESNELPRLDGALAVFAALRAQSRCGASRKARQPGAVRRWLVLMPPLCS